MEELRRPLLHTFFTFTYQLIFKDEDRRSLLRSLSDDQYRDIIRVLALIPILDVEVTTEVVDDDDQHVVTAGAIITVTVALTRR